MPPAPSSGFVKIISVDRDEILARLKEAAACICAEHPEVRSVRLFGSMARGDQTGVSDADIMIILCEDRPIDPLERIKSFLKYFDLKIGVDLLVFTEQQIVTGLKEGDLFITQLWGDSLPLYDRGA